MRYNYCYCPRDYENLQLLVSTLNEVMTDWYLTFSKQNRFLIWNLTEEVDVFVPKHYTPHYEQKMMECKMRCIELIDLGYTNGYFTEDVIETMRMEIATYLMNKNTVWE